MTYHSNSNCIPYHDPHLPGDIPVSARARAWNLVRQLALHDGGTVSCQRVLDAICQEFPDTVGGNKKG